MFRHANVVCFWASCGIYQCSVLHDSLLILVDDTRCDHREEAYFWCVGAVLFILRSRLIVYSQGSGVNRM